MPSKNQNVEYRTENNSSFMNSIYNSTGEAKELSESSYNLLIKNSTVINKGCSRNHFPNKYDSKNGETSVIYACNIIVEPINPADSVLAENVKSIITDNTACNRTSFHHRKKNGKTGVKFIQNPVFKDCTYIDNEKNSKPIVYPRYFEINSCNIIDDTKRCQYDEYGRIVISNCNIVLIPIIDKIAIRVLKSTNEIDTMIETTNGDDGDDGGIGIKHKYFGE